MRTVLAAALFAVALALTALSFFALRNLWAEYPDSSDSTYIQVAVVEWALAALAAWLGWWVLRGRSDRRRD